MRILVADDHPLLREGLIRIIREEFPEASFGEASSTGEAIDRLHQGTWDVVLLDICMPGRGGIDILGESQQLAPSSPVLIVSSAPEDQLGIRSIKGGAAGYLNKQAASGELIGAIRKILDGGRYITPTLAEQLAQEISQPSAKHPHQNLSNREFEVFECLIREMTLKEIAAELCISPKTASTFRGRILEKLGVHNDIGLANYAHDHGLRHLFAPSGKRAL